MLEKSVRIPVNEKDSRSRSLIERRYRSEKASIDEAYLDLTGLAMQEILKRHPHISSVPEDAPFGLDTPLPPPPPITWDPLSNIFPLRGDNGKPTEGDGDGYDGLIADEEAVGGWEDYALSVGAEIMGNIRAEVKRELGYTCSAVSVWSGDHTTDVILKVPF